MVPDLLRLEKILHCHLFGDQIALDSMTNIFFFRKIFPQHNQSLYSRFSYVNDIITGPFSNGPRDDIIFLEIDKVTY